MVLYEIYSVKSRVTKCPLTVLLLELRMKTDYFYTAQHLHRVYGRLIFR
jgi:hypothetical protein